MQRLCFVIVLWSLTTPIAGTTPVTVEPGQRPPASFSTSEGSVHDWTSRLTSTDPKVRASAETALVAGGQRSLPLLRTFLTDPEEALHQVTFEILRRIGPVGDSNTRAAAAERTAVHPRRRR